MACRLGSEATVSCQIYCIGILNSCTKLCLGDDVYDVSRLGSMPDKCDKDLS